MHDELKLEACPFCGQQPHTDCSGPNEYDIECYCRAGVIICGPTKPTLAEAAAAWNTRAAPANTEADVERVVETVEDAGREAYQQGYRDGHVDARYPEGFDGDEREVWREIDGICVGDGWNNYRDTFLSALSLTRTAGGEEVDRARRTLETIARQDGDPMAYPQLAAGALADLERALIKPPALPKEGEEFGRKLVALRDCQMVIGEGPFAEEDYVLVRLDRLADVLDGGHSLIAALSSLPVRSGEVGIARDELPDPVCSGASFKTGLCHACGHNNRDRDWPMRIDTGVRGALEGASRLINQMDRDKVWVSQDVSAVLAQIGAALATPQQVKEGDRHG